MKAEAQVRKIAEAVVDTIVGGSLDEAKRKIAQLRESNIDWLNRRIQEVRVAI